MKTVTAMILAAALLLGAAGPARAAVVPGADGALTYERCDAEAFYEGTEHLCELADGGYTDGVLTLYDRLHDEFLRIDTMSTLALLGHYDDIYDEYWSGEYNYMARLLSEAGDALCAAAACVLDSGCADDFRAYVGQEAADYFADYEPMTDEQFDDYERELALIDEYYALVDGLGAVEVEHGGRSWTIDDLMGSAGDDLAMWDYWDYMDLYSEFQETLSRRFAPVYIELVQLRTRQAREAGWDSFADYAYERMYGREYTTEQIQTLCDAVKPIAREYNETLYYSQMPYAYGEAEPAMDAPELLEVLDEYLPRIDGSLTGPLAYMTANGLYDLAPAAEGRLDGAFTTELSYYGCPYIFATLEGSCYDLSTLTHEYGHYTNFYYNPLPDWLMSADDLDLSEIHSNGLQALFTRFYGEIYDKGADAAEFANLSFLLNNVIDGCLFDEFQRRVCERADELDAELLNEIYMDLCGEYGLYEAYYAVPDWDAGWTYISHSFDSPFYYISYAVSALSAIELWSMAQDDFRAAADVYLDVLDHGAYAEGYFAVLEDCGLRPFTDAEATQPCRVLLDRLLALDEAYSRRSSLWELLGDEMSGVV